MHFADKVLEHFFGNGEVGDHTVLHGPNGRDMPGGAAQHVLGFSTHCFDLLATAARFLTNRHHRWLIEHDAAATHVNQRICRAQINRQVI